LGPLDFSLFPCSVVGAVAISVSSVFFSSGHLIFFFLALDFFACAKRKFWHLRLCVVKSPPSQFSLLFCGEVKRNRCLENPPVDQIPLSMTAVR